MKVLCPYCNKLYTTKMLYQLYAYASGCSTCGNGEANGTIKITCENCGKKVYEKEISTSDKENYWMNDYDEYFEKL